MLNIFILEYSRLGFPDSSNGKEPACNVGDLVLIPGWGRSTGEMHGNPLQYSCLENPTDRRAWWATVHGVRKSQTDMTQRLIHTWLINNVMMVPDVQQSDSVIHVHGSVLFKLSSI